MLETAKKHNLLSIDHQFHRQVLSIKKCQHCRHGMFNLITLWSFKGKLHSKIISSDMKDFFRRIQWCRSEVEIRTGRRSNRQSKKAEKSRVTPPRGRHESLVPGVSSSRLRPDSDQSRIN